MKLCESLAVQPLHSLLGWCHPVKYNQYSDATGPSYHLMK